MGASAPFRTDVDGYFLAPLVTVPDVPVNGMLYAQVRAWEAAAVATYEEARGKGGKFGFSQVVFAKPTNPFAKILVPAFKLQAGLPFSFSGQLGRGRSCRMAPVLHPARRWLGRQFGQCLLSHPYQRDDTL